MLNIRLIWCICIWCISIYNYAQIFATGDENIKAFFDSAMNGKESQFKMFNEENSTPTIGSYYLFSDWVEGIVKIKNDKRKYQITDINYNLINNNLEIKTSKDSVFVVDSRIIDEILIGSSIFKKIELLHNESKISQVLLETKGMLFLKTTDLAVSKGKVNPLNGEISPNRFNKIVSYYLLKDEQINKLKLNKKSLLSLFKNKKEIIVTFVKDNNLSFKNEDDFIIILKEFIAE